MIKAYFASDPKVSLLQLVDEFLQSCIELSRSTESVELDLMLFSFTDAKLADRIRQIVTDHPTIKLRILADWGNISNRDHRKLLDLTEIQAANFEVKFKFDLPYLWDPLAEKLRWSYHASLGLLHHKSILIKLSGKPFRLLCGSLNWTKTGGQNYENLLRIDANSKAEIAMVEAMNKEFESLWNNDQLAKSLAEASLIKARVIRWYKTFPEATPAEMQRELLRLVNKNNKSKELSVRTRLDHKSLLAFSSNDPFSDSRKKGANEQNSLRQFAMQKPSGQDKWVPLDIQTAALDLIYSANPGEELCLCMYAFSPRVPEYTALLEMARAGVRFRCILDRGSNKGMIQKLHEVAERDTLDIQVLSGTRGMHQKYMVNATSSSLITGTANMSTDSYYRHYEHRFLIRTNKRLAEAFQADFERIWTRIGSS